MTTVLTLTTKPIAALLFSKGISRAVGPLGIKGVRWQTVHSTN